MQRDEVLRKLRELAQELGKETLTLKNINESSLSMYWVRKYYDSLASALEAAGLQPTKLAKSIATTDDELLDYLADLQRRLGRRPTIADIDRDGEFSQRIFYSRFGSPGKALLRLDERQVPRERQLDGQPSAQDSSLLPVQEILGQLREDVSKLSAKIETVAEQLPLLLAKEGPQLSFVHTSPDFRGTVYDAKVTSIQDTIRDMLKKAKRSVRISTRQMDMFESELTRLKEDNPDMEITVLSRGPEGAEGPRKRIAGRAFEVMGAAGIYLPIEQDLLHSRMVVIDEQEVLMSSADLDYTQMEKEFNAGIWTNDPDVVAEAIEYFDNLVKSPTVKLPKG